MCLGAECIGKVVSYIGLAAGDVLGKNTEGPWVGLTNRCVVIRRGRWDRVFLVDKINVVLQGSRNNADIHVGVGWADLVVGPLVWPDLG